MVGAAACFSIATKSTITGSGSIGGLLKKLKLATAATRATTCTAADRTAGVRISMLSGERSNIERYSQVVTYRRGGVVGPGAVTVPPGLAGAPCACSPSRPS